VKKWGNVIHCFNMAATTLSARRPVERVSFK
jgi:hypothetical protein